MRRILFVTYFGYHLFFNLPLLLLLVWLVRRRFTGTHATVTAVVALVAFVFTTPWDNWAVAQGMWSFDWDRVTPVAVDFGGRTWRLPMEEYAFFIVETVAVCLLATLFLPRPAEP